MIIRNLDHLEEVIQTPDVEGGLMGTSSLQSFLQPFYQAVQIYPASTSGIYNLGSGTSSNNTSISINFVMPTTIAVNAPTSHQMSSSLIMRGTSTIDRQSQGMQALGLFGALFGFEKLLGLF